MDYIYYNLGFLKIGSSIEVALDKQANIILLDDFNYQNYKKGRRYIGYGGIAKQSPYIIEITKYTHWNLVIDLGGKAGRLRHSIKVIE